MKTVTVAGRDLDLIDVKNWVVTRGVRIDDAVYDWAAGEYSLTRDARKLTCLILSNGYTCSLYDMGPQLEQAAVKYHWSDLEKEEMATQKGTPLRICMDGDKPALTYQGLEFIDYVSFPKAHTFYEQTTKSGLPYRGNVSLLGNNAYVVFGYEWPCDYAKEGFPCHYCHSGHETAAQAKHGECVKEPIAKEDMAEMVNRSLRDDLAVSILYTGGSTFDGVAEHKYLSNFIDGMNEYIGRENIPGQILFYLTPPKDLNQLDHYVANGIDKMAMSVEVWNEDLAAKITPGKIKYTTRERHLRALTYAAEKFGGHHVFCQLVVGCEPLEDAAKGIQWLGERGITPVFSILQQTSLKINGRTQPPDLDFYIRAKELWLDAYARYDIEPEGWEYSIGCLGAELYEEAHQCSHWRYPRPDAGKLWV